MLIKISIFFIMVIIIITTVLFAKAKRNQANIIKFTEMLVSDSSLKKRGSIDFDTLSNLPKPVENYFKNVLGDTKKLITIARFEQSGKLRVQPNSKKWYPFTATYITSEDPVAFIWNAKIQILPLIHIRVIDTFFKGQGSGKVSLFSAITLGEDNNHAVLNSSSLYRYLAEAVWHPTALLPQSGIKWEAIDDNRALAHLRVKDISIALEFSFNTQGEITGIYTKNRFGRFDNQYIQYPWAGKFKNYQEFNGIKIPTEGQVGWHLPGGWWLFWKGKIHKAVFQYNKT